LQGDLDVALTPGIGTPINVRFCTSGTSPQAFVQTADNSKKAIVKIEVFSLDGKMLFGTQALTNAWTSLPCKTKGARIVTVKSGRKTVFTKAGLF
jgi:hypothetical protein